MQAEGEQPSDLNLYMPMTLAIQQSIVETIRYQNRLVNKCLLHFSHRKVGMLKHFELMKMVFLCSKGDVI
jgi:hypothetical protein